MRQTYRIDGIEYPSKKALRERAQAILRSYPPGARLGPSDARFIYGLLLMHPTPAQKIGCGIKYFQVRENDWIWLSHGFWLVRHGGTEEGFSYRKCLTYESHRAKFNRACRQAIAPTVLEWKRQALRECGRCPYTDELLTRKSADVDHAPPWTMAAIIDEFIRSRRLDVEMVDLATPDGRGAFGYQIVDEALCADFVQFHNERARFRLISPYANQVLLAGQGRRSSTLTVEDVLGKGLTP